MHNPIELFRKLSKHFEAVEAASKPAEFATATPAQVEEALKQRTRCDCKKGKCRCTWESTFTNPQRKRIQQYNQMWRDRFGKIDDRAIYHVNDSPKIRRVWSGASGAVPCLRRAMGPLFMPTRQRVLLPQELLTAMGWFCSPEAARHAGVPGHHLKPDKDINWPKLLGNSMHLAQARLPSYGQLGTYVRVASVACCIG